MQLLQIKKNKKKEYQININKKYLKHKERYILGLNNLQAINIILKLATVFKHTYYTYIYTVPRHQLY